MEQEGSAPPWHVETERELGPVSVLVNNAGILEWGTIEEQPLESFRRVIDVNLQGSWLGMRTAAPSLRRAGGGVIVNISSIAGITGITGYAGIGAYVAGKWLRVPFAETSSGGPVP